MGITVHDALAYLATDALAGVKTDIDKLASVAYAQMYEQLYPKDGVVLPEQVEFAKEQATLVEGMLRGFYKHVWPKLLDQYKIVAIEQEMEYRLDPEGQFIFMAKPDLIVETKEGELVYIEYKTTSDKKEKWIQSWETAVQLHSSILATEQTLGRRPAYVQIVGLYKGYESYGKQGSPFCYAYKKSGNPPFTQDQTAYEFKAGFKRYPTWELPGGTKTWIDAMPDNVLTDQFPLTAPIFVNEDLVESFFRQRYQRENDILCGVQGMADNPDDDTIIDDVFPQRFDQCAPGFGRPCQYKKLCHANVPDPLTDGFELRQPHHARELENLSE